ncbi:hypothetical protein HanOQP8_Chr10g0379111 [Helianthus annuus]|nr:hypothetical protein HanOQP8_Chr10g0379111 [Helianthus annuus]
MKPSGNVHLSSVKSLSVSGRVCCFKEGSKMRLLLVVVILYMLSALGRLVSGVTVAYAGQDSSLCSI